MSQKHLITISVLSLLALGSLALWVFIGVKAHSLKDEAVSIESDMATKTSESAYLNSVRNVLKSSKSDLAAINSRFIDKDGVPSFIDLLERKAKTAGVQADFGSIVITPADAGGGTLKLSMTGSGTWSNIIQFISVLESLPYASRIETASFSTIDKKWTFSLEFIQHLTIKN